MFLDTRELEIKAETALKVLWDLMTFPPSNPPMDQNMLQVKLEAASEILELFKWAKEREDCENERNEDKWGSSEPPDDENDDGWEDN